MTSSAPRRRRATASGAAAALVALVALVGCTDRATDATGSPRDDAVTGGATDSDAPSSATDPSDLDPADADGAGATEGADPDPAGTADDAEVETTASRELPATFPPEVALPAEYVINVATESVTETSRSYVLQLRTPGEPAAVFEQLTTRFVDGGWEELQQGTSNFGGTFTSSATYSNGTILVNLGVIDGEQPGSAAVSYSVVPAGPATTGTADPAG